MISRLDGQSKFQMFTLFSGLYGFVRNISTNISTWGQRTQLKLGELSFLFIVYIITFFDFIHCIVFDLIFLLRDSTHTLCVNISYQGGPYWEKL